MSDQGVDHTAEWMKLQEESNQEIAKALLHIDERLKSLEQKVKELDRRTFGLIRMS